MCIRDRRTSPYKEYVRWFVKSEVYRVSAQREKYFYVEADEWVHFELKEFENYHWRVNVTPGQWYVLEAYDAYNSDETGTELFLSYGGQVTRNPDGHMIFLKPDTNQIEFFGTSTFTVGTLGTFKFRVRSIEPSNLQAMEGEHVFTQNSEIKFAERYFEAGTYTTVSYTHLRAHETSLHLVCRLLLDKKLTYKWE